MTRALIIECDEQQATFSNGDMLQFSDDSINLTDATRVNDMTGYCISLDYYNDFTGNYECYYEFFQTLAGFIYPINWCSYDYDDESHCYYVDECTLDSDEPIAIIKEGSSKDSNLNFWRAMYKAVQAMQDYVVSRETLEKGLTMVSIKWSNGYSNFKTTYYKPFKHLDSCNAAWYENVTIGDSSCNALGHDYKYETFGFVSYDTPIMFVWHAIDMTDGHDFYDIHVNLESFNCSSATIHQLVRFMRYVFGDCFTYQDLKSYCMQYGKIYKSLSFRSYISGTVYFSDYHNLETLMKAHDNATWITDYE